MPAPQKDERDTLVSREREILRMPELTVSAEKAGAPFETILVSEATIPQFRYRVLVVDDDPSVRQTAAAILEREGYEVLTGADGIEGLHALSKSLPDVIISDLNMPRMSGFEFLAIVRKRFPHIATIAVSGEYITAGESSSGILADAFFQKGHYALKELFQEIAELLAASPIRSEKEKSDIAPLFVRRDNAGYLIIACTKCLRPNKLDATSLNGGIHQTICQSCGTPVRFEINHEIEPLIKHQQVWVHSDTSEEIKRAKAILERTGAQDISSIGEASGDKKTSSADREVVEVQRDPLEKSPQVHHSPLANAVDPSGKSTEDLRKVS